LPPASPVLHTTLARRAPDRHGKVRDIYDYGDRLIIVATDRISAFDYVLGSGIPDKGKVLTQISTFWFERTRSIVVNHLLSTDPPEYPDELSGDGAILAGRSLEDLNEIYLANLAEQFGDSVLVAPEFRYEWLSIPHIYQTPFYCYAYSFGQLLVLALYRRYQEQGAAFKPGYLELLGYGGSARPEAILAEVGIDMTDRRFWQGGFDLVRQRIDELEAIRI